MKCIKQNITNKTLYTKHFYAESQRLASKLGAGLASSIVDPTQFQVTEVCSNYEEKSDSLLQKLARGWSRTAVGSAEIEPGNVSIENPELQVINDLAEVSADEPESDIYFYHSDHLGSSSWITDAGGDVNQHLQYLPFGEDYIYQRTNSWNIPYTFSGKEKDAETGYSYFGARYYDSDVSVWLSVDPMAMDFPHISPYNYVEQNPVKYIDEEGENPIGAFIGAVVGAAKEIASQTISNGFANLENGEGFFNGWSDKMDWADVGISTVEGALAGLTMGASLGVTLAIEGGAAVARSSIDWRGDDKTPNVIFGQGDYKKDWAEFGYDIAGEALSMGFRYGTGLNKVDFYGKNGPDFSGAFWKTVTEGTFDGIWKTPSSIYKREYYNKRKRSNEAEPPIFGGNLPPVEIHPPSHEKASQNLSTMRKKYLSWLLK